MEVVSTSRFPCAAITWRSRRIGWVVTVVTKTTFSLVAGESEVAPKQRRMNQSDAEGDANVLRRPSDFVPFKTRPEVLLVGSAFAPRKSRVSRLVARLVVGEVDKQIEVHSDRWMTRDGEIVPGQPFDRMPLGWERAAGGIGTDNPLGLAPTVKDDRGRRRLPNLQPMGTHLSAPSDPIEPVGFGPMPSSWPLRRKRLGSGATSLLSKRWFDEPLPDDFDPSFFNAAPHDQQVDTLPGDMHLVLENLTPIAPRFVTNLPRLEPHIVIERGGASQELHAAVDTFFIDTDRGLCTLTWRVHTPISGPGEKGRVRVEFEGHPPSRGEIPDFETMTGEEPADEHHPSMPTIQTDVASDPRGVLPFREARAAPQTDPPPSSQTALHPEPAPATDVPPARRGAPATLLGRNPLPQELRDVLPFREPAANSAARAPSSRPEPAAPHSSSGRPPPSAPPPAHVQAAPPMQPPPPPHAAIPPAPPVASSIPGVPQWAGPGPSPTSGAVRAIQPPPQPAPVHRDSQPVPRGVVAASDAAAEVRQAPLNRAPSRTRARARELVDLLWFHDDAPTRVRQRGEWFTLLRDISREPEWITGEAAEQELAPIKDRRDVARALSRVPPTAGNEISIILQESVDEDGIYERPLLVVSGDLSMTFEPLEILRTSASVASQFSSADKRLKDAVDAAQAVLGADHKTPARLIDNLQSQLRQVFVQTNRSLPNDYLDSAVQELLIEQRMYQRRSILGGPHLRTSFIPSGATHGLPTYLPELVRERLPLFQRFRVRMLVEPHPPQDPIETDSVALVALAIARVAPLS